MSPHRAPARPRHGRLAVAGTTLALAAPFAVAGSAALATESTVNPVEAGKSITVLHNIDMVAITGYGPAGTQVRVEVTRGGAVIGWAAGRTVATDEGPGLEVNHGVDGTPVAGDCWNVLPDIQPEDHVVVHYNGGLDEIIVDELRFTGGPRMEGTDVVVTGVAKRHDGTPIPVGLLDSGEFRFRNAQGEQYRANPDDVVAGSTAGSFEMHYRAPYAGFRNEGLDQEERRLALLNNPDGHAIGFGHTEPPPGDAQMIEGFGTAGGPAEGCPGGPVDGPEDPDVPGEEPENPPPAADTVRPTVTPVSPRAGQTGVWRGTNVTTQFSEAVRAGTVTSNLKLHRVSSTGSVLSSVAAAVRYDAATQRAVLDPATRLAGNARYRVTATVGILDTAGNQLVRKVYYFRTRA